MHIVLALDGSAESLEATNEVVRIPWATKPTVTIVTALVEKASKFVSASENKILQDAESENARKLYETSREMLEASCERIEHVLERKHPRQLILEVAEQVDADVIVLGARGHSVAYRVVVGSTAEYVANHAKCSVLLTRIRDDNAESDSQGFRLMAAYDGSQESKVAFQQLCALAWPSATTSLHIAMVLDRPKLLPEHVVYDPPLVAESETVLSELARPADRFAQVTQSVREAMHSGNAICGMADDKRSNLLFVGGTGKSSVARFFLGSTTRYLLHHAQCSIWIARPKHWA